MPKEASIPEALIYEMNEGQPIYYRGYREVLSGDKKVEDIIGDSNLQAWLKGELFAFIRASLLGKDYVVTVGEQGLSLEKKSWRSADIAIFRKNNFALTKKYAQYPPDVVIEIDTKADFSSLGEAMAYYDEKVQQLFDFGVKKIIWIFTDYEKVKLITPDQEQKTISWKEDITVLEDISINIKAIIDSFSPGGLAEKD